MWGSNSSSGKGIYLLPKISRPPMRPTQSPIQYNLAPFPRVTQPEGEAGHLAQSSAEDKIYWL